jgi:hypothetical protein
MTRFVISVAFDLKEVTPQQIIDILEHMVGLQQHEFDDLPKHVFFDDEYWDSTLHGELSSFPGEGGAALRRVTRYMRPITQGGDNVYFHTFSFRCESKDDGLASFDALLDWLAPHSHTQGFIGYLEYEDDKQLDLLYFLNGALAISDNIPPP